MKRMHSSNLLVIGAFAAFGVLMYLAGWAAGSHASVAQSHPLPVATAAQNPVPFQEVIPLPTPDERQGQGQGQDCQPIILFYYQGRLYQLMPGPQGQQGRPGSPPEFFPLRPYQGPAIPGLPFGPQTPFGPQGPQPRLAPPPFQPVQPRF